MREIKFRAWDDNNNEIIPWEKIVIEKLDGETKLSVVVYDGSVGDYYDHFPIMQFTGLTDKNGVEIYEEDILKVSWRKISDAGEVVYFGSGFYVTNMSRHAPFLLSDAVAMLEVIGNIHENPELLESST